MFKANIMEKTKYKRIAFFAFGDGLLLALSVFLSFYLRFDGDIPPVYVDRFGAYLLLFLTVKYTVFAVFRLYKMSWTYVEFFELLDILKAISVSLVLLTVLIMPLWHTTFFSAFPRAVLIIDYCVSLVLITMFRTSRRVFRQMRNGINNGDKKRTLIVGACDAGEQIARDMRRQRSSPYTPVGFVDDDETRHGVYIHGIKVLGCRADIPRLVGKLNVEIILIAIISATSRDIRQILSYAQNSSVKKVMVIPSLKEHMNGGISLSDIKTVRIEDIIGREQISIDKKSVSAFIRGKRLLITGAGGSIGSELVRQALTFRPEMIIALDIDETELHRIELELIKSRRSELVPVLADIRDKRKIQSIFDKYHPDVVFHAAAYKHVPMMEKFPEEAVSVNIFGTKIVAEAALDFGTEKFVLVSTDKAVKPRSVMGATKCVAEKIVKALNNHGKTRYSSVRFGNVLGSRGSVIKIFEDQIKRGIPVTVTHEDMTRYFISIPEACILILQAATMGYGGEVFHLDMGKQVKILDIARELIHLNGLEPDVDVPIVFSGIRQGEKLYEELITDSEYSEPTEHPKILRVKDNSNNYESVLGKVMLFDDIIRRKQWAWIRNLLYDLVPSYELSFGKEDVSFDMPLQAFGKSRNY